MRRWKRTAEGGSYVTNEKIDAFINEVLAVCEKHGLSISHEGGHGQFEIENFNGNLSDWLRDAIDNTEFT